MKSLAKLIRIATTAPFIAILLVTSLYVYNASLLGSLQQYIALIIFLSVLPLLAYYSL